jgi:hypothetical protein
MTNLFVQGAILILLLQAAPQSQSRKTELPVSDKSSAGSPLHAFGNATLSGEITSKGIESTAEMTAVLKNISTKPIMAFEAVTDLFGIYGGGDSMTSRVDYFFDGLLMPGSTSEIILPSHKTIVFWNGAEHPSTLDNIHVASQPRADVRVTFVQFADGNTFGASQWAGILTAQRDCLMEIFRDLLRAFDTKKEVGLKSAIEENQARPELSAEISSSLSMIQRKFREEGAVVTVQYLSSRLANAEHHSNTP